MKLGDGDPRRLIKPAIGIWCLAVICTLWNPPRVSAPEPPYFRLERVVPFWSYFYSRTLADLADVIGQVLIFMPLGALLAARTNRQSFAGAMVLGLLLGVVIEIGQAFLPGARPTSVTRSRRRPARGSAWPSGDGASLRVRARPGRSAIASAAGPAS